MASWKFHLMLMEKYHHKPMREWRAQQRKLGKKPVPPPVPPAAENDGKDGWSWL